MPRRFRLARMCPTFRILTALLMLLPVGFLALGLAVPNPESRVLLATGLFLGLLYLGIALYSRPTHFELSDTELAIVWPIRRLGLPRSDLRGARPVQRRAFRDEFGWGMRIGAGGLWGAFGWLWTSRRGRLDLAISRLDGWVLVERASGRPYLLTPEDPDAFVDALR